jgi:anti-sigma B factor antagonist
MKIQKKIIKRVAVLTILGRLMGPSEGETLFNAVKKLLEDDVFRIVLDLSHVDWINSVGVGSILKCYTVMQQAQGVLHLVGLSEKVRSVFIIARLSKVFTIHDDVDEAVALLNQQ